MLKKTKEVTMAIVKFDPFREISGMMSKMGEFLSDFESGLVDNRRGFYPTVDISEDEKNIYINVELPGLTKDDVQIKVKDDNTLMIKGEKKFEEKKENKDHSYIRIERRYGEFSRFFALPENVDKDKISAKFDNGVLHLSIEKKEPEKPNEKLIEIQ
jgi:HSP20 family protein